MKKPNGSRWFAFFKKYWNFLLFALVAVITVWIIHRDLNLSVFMEIYHSANKVYFLIGTLFQLIYIMIEAWLLMRLIRNQYPKETYGQSFTLSIIGQYYNLVTPGASGGQPLQLIEMATQGIATGYGTAVLVLKYMLYEVSVTVVGMVSCLLNLDMIFSMSGTSKAFVAFGLIINILGSALILLVAFYPKIAKFIMVGLVRLGCAVHLLKDRDAWMEKGTNFVDDYQMAVTTFSDNPKEIVRLFVVNILAICLYFGITFWVYRALGLHEYHWFQIVGIQAILYLFYTFIPLPGGSGGAEIGFSVIMGPVFGNGKSAVAMVIWRFLTFYLVLIFGGIYIALHSFIQGLRDDKGQKHARNQHETDHGKNP